jgi:hypothetical protein
MVKKKATKNNKCSNLFREMKFTRKMMPSHTVDVERSAYNVSSKIADVVDSCYNGFSPSFFTRL